MCPLAQGPAPAPSHLCATCARSLCTLVVQVEWPEEAPPECDAALAGPRLHVSIVVDAREPSEVDAVDTGLEVLFLLLVFLELNSLVRLVVSGTPAALLFRDGQVAPSKPFMRIPWPCTSRLRVAGSRWTAQACGTPWHSELCVLRGLCASSRTREL